jgi:hypothetical protein
MILHIHIKKVWFYIKKYYFKKYISTPIDNLKINYTRIHTYTYTNICVL